ncbi:hypothetical protein MRB53_011161 [Persea americana]|uniref:Uncharacterized protein n=1 Tax=Persea americana TaxID=3435 RepID=A0ACC2LTZ8_PERAE|nr:hypothetical protein MRB53_011161 [Persea americana]|eukprot:TRINITY_DN68951_c0_g1_i1.p1 TRINITY_DN68951_c0_g1~~TRINITY_DN68951_c0_g1_i1.p1  ORF type:complete len:164 (+),score=25.35 TRINITY_DN68951_c0_g1_i1:163-654(+)
MAMAIKRLREEDDSLKTANYLMLLSRGHSDGGKQVAPVAQLSDRVFECKTCNRQFSSFQALGGHRASHKRPRTIDDHCKESSPVKPKVHECSICGSEFAIGQALGGHMRRHRNTIEGFSVVPVVKKSENKKMGCLDLNFPPSENEQPELMLGIGLYPLMSTVH